MNTGKKRVVLAYSGGLDTSIILKWLGEEHDYDVVAFAADLGQKEELDGVPAKARRTGGIACEVLDLKETFVRDFVFPMLRMNAIYEGQYFLGTAIARPCIAQAQVKLARKYKAAAVSHGATGKGNDQVRFELTFAALGPDLEVIAPWREWSFQGRAELIDYARRHGIPIPVTKAKPYSSDRNAYHISFEGGILEDPWSSPPDDMWLLTTDPKKAPNKSEEVVIHYDKGNPVAVNGKRMSPYRLLDALNRIGGKHGVGRTDCVENRYVGLKSRGCYETPGGTILMAAHRALETITLDREVMHLRDGWIPRYAECVYYGYWFAPEREMLQSACDEIQKNVTGEVKVRLYKGNVDIRGRRAPKTSLYRPDLVSFEKGGTYDQRDATGFIRLSGLRLKIGATVKGRK